MMAHSVPDEVLDEETPLGATIMIYQSEDAEEGGYILDIAMVDSVYDTRRCRVLLSEENLMAIGEYAESQVGWIQELTF